MKVPTKHGLDRKFKPWRKGKSSNSNKRSSLKQQLRGMERLLAKISQNPEKDPNNREGVDQKTKELKSKIAALKQEISRKQQSMVEKKHAEKAHGQRFLDRQRLTRLEKKVRKSGDKDKEKQLTKIALDQVYVAYHPNDVKYMPLFKHGKRVLDQSRQLFRRAVTRKRILRGVKTSTKVNWIGADQYDRLPTKEWTIQDEEQIFGGSISRSSKENSTIVSKAEDSRFNVDSSHEALLIAAEQAETEMLQEDQKGANISGGTEKIKNTKSITKDTTNDSGSSSSSSSSSSEDDEVDPLSSKESRKSDLKSVNEMNVEQNKQGGFSSDTDSSDSDSEIDHAKPHPSTTKNSNRNDEKDSSDRNSDSSSESESDDSSDSDTSDSEDDSKALSKKNPGMLSTLRTREKEVVEEEEADDFLIDATDDDNAFRNAAVQIPALSSVRGDKSKGFETQSQRPGEFKKRRIRRY